MARTLKHDLKSAIYFHRQHEEYEKECAKKYPVTSEEYLSCIKGAEYNKGVADALLGVLARISESIG